MLLTSLSSLAKDNFVSIFNSLALVWLRFLQCADLSSDLSDLLLIDSTYRNV